MGPDQPRLLAPAARLTPRPVNVGAGRADGAPDRDTRSTERLGLPFALVVVWLGFEFGRPSNPMGIPLLISSVLLIGWIMRRDKRWSAQSSLLVAFLAVMAAGVPLATNRFSAFWSLYSMASFLVCICIPLPSIVRSLRAVRLAIYAFVGVAFYVGLWAVFNHGYGPAGAGGAQDENYVSAMMGMAVSFAYFAMFATKSRLTKLLLMGSIPVFLGACLAGYNVSRGGFLGLCAVFGYCVLRSPRRGRGVVVLLLLLVLVVPFAPQNYWDEVMSIGDVDAGTADLRVEIWKIGARMWAAHPILGVGAGNFRWVVGTYQSAEQLDKFDRDLGGSIIAHSLLVELVAELGTAGAVVLLLLLWRTSKDLRYVIRQGARRGKRPAPPDERVALRCYADGVAGALVACLVNGMFLSLLYFSYVWLFVMLASAIRQVPDGPTPSQGT